MEIVGFNELKSLYEECHFTLSDFKIEAESQEYGACRFKLNNLQVVYRNAKTTPKKTGQFVTCWKRIDDGPIEPFSEMDHLDLLVVTVSTADYRGQFVFPKSALLKKGIITTSKKEGKRAFRVYPPWDLTNSPQAQRTQKWQLDYFLAITDRIDLNKTTQLYSV